MSTIDDAPDLTDDKRLNVATNAAAWALYADPAIHDDDSRIDATPEQIDAARRVAQRVLDQVGEYDLRQRSTEAERLTAAIDAASAETDTTTDAALAEAEAAIADVRAAEAATPPVPERTVVVYGASDDCIEIAGSIYDEFSAMSYDDGDDGGLLAFTDGTVLSVKYTNEGIWRVDAITIGPESTVDRHPCQFPSGDAADDADTRYRTDGPDGTDVPNYSDWVRITGPITGVVMGDRFIAAK